MRIVLALLLGLAASASAQPAAGDNPVEALAQRATAEYEAGNFLKAVELYREAYAVGKVSTILYNIALIYDRKIGDPDLAMEFYRQYLATPDADPKASSRAMARLQELKAAKAKAEAATRKQEAEAREAEARRREEEAARKAAEAARAEQKPREGSGLATGGWILAGVGVAAVGGGVAFGLSASKDADDFKASRSLSEKKSLRDDGEGKALIADILMGVGAAAAITGLIMVAVAPGDDAPSATVGPTADGAGATLWIGGRL
ncbi:MAG: hypothetical protein R3F60_00985 [bacterium]